jgi:hypothetical protein
MAGTVSMEGMASAADTVSTVDTASMAAEVNWLTSGSRPVRFSPPGAANG